MRSVPPSLALVLTLALAFVPSLAQASEPARVWVFFTDHGRDQDQLEAELRARRAELGPRTLARRAKVRRDALVDARDLLPAPAYLAAVEGRGAALRVRSRWLNAVSVDADPEARAAIAALPFVRGLQPVAGQANAELELTPAPAPANPDDYGVGWEQLEAIGVPALHDCGLSGAGVILGVQDTGFALDHQAYATTEILAEHDFIDEDDVVGPELGDPPNQHVHGTLVLATITGDDPGSFRGAAPGVSVLLSKTEHVDVEEPWEEDTYVQGLEWIEAMGADIFSASLIYSAWYTPDDLDGATAVTTLAVEAAVANGLIVFAPMGNTGPNASTLGAPADAAGAISLGATDVMGQLADFSSRGPTGDGRIKPDVLTPGWQIYTVDPATTDSYVQSSGTSFSAPIAAGVGALLLEAYPWLTPADMAELLRSTASQTDAPDSDHGYGLIDAAAAAELYCSCVDLDGDFYFDQACGGTDCDDDDPSAHPGAEEVCDGVDNDCDGMLGLDEADADADAHLACAGDCDDGDAAINPEAIELCDNGVDDDCDMLTDALDPDCASGDGDGDPSGDGDPGDGDPGDPSGSDSTGSTGDGADAGLGGGEPGCACALGGGSRPFAPLAPLAALLGLVLARRRRR